MRDNLVPDLAARLEQTLESLLPAGSRCALLNGPRSPNPGDHAIWLGEKALLRRLGISVSYESQVWRYSREELLARCDPEAIILLHGGGHFGDLWTYTGEQLSERILGDLKGFRIVQLPQSIHFENPRNLERMQRLIDAHGDVTILARERQSFDFARERFSTPVIACPDAAFAMDVPTHPQRRRCDVLWLSRTDLEARAGNQAITAPGVLVMDWRGVAGVVPRLKAKRPRSLDRAAVMHVKRAFGILRLGRVVVTDRLHGHILSLMAGIPHVVLDNSYGKTRSFYETWTSASPLATWADSAEQALDIAERALEEPAPTR
jgi:exopolysaccharide biosynthesis protein PssK